MTCPGASTLGFFLRGALLPRMPADVEDDAPSSSSRSIEMARLGGGGTVFTCDASDVGSLDDEGFGNAGVA